jgi:hypothetical protein
MPAKRPSYLNDALTGFLVYLAITTGIDEVAGDRVRWGRSVAVAALWALIFTALQMRRRERDPG